MFSLYFLLKENKHHLFVLFIHFFRKPATPFSTQVSKSNTQRRIHAHGLILKMSLQQRVSGNQSNFVSELLIKSMSLYLGVGSLQVVLVRIPHTWM